jgi:anti-sigma regulatory factor (Ser/Thr protein kinase)
VGKDAKVNRMLKLYPITPELAEDEVWTHDILPSLGTLGENALDIWETSFTEMFNNAIDHSEGSQITVRLTSKENETEIVVSDDGVGIFRKIQAALSLPDERQALLELSKGKLTTDPEKHSGQGIFFTSRMLDTFAILSGITYFSHKSRQEVDWIMEDPDPEKGTYVLMKLDNNTSRTCKEIYDQYSSGDDYGFTKTVIPIQLARHGGDKLVSRSQAKRVLARIDRFKTVVFDFSEVDVIGQAFADEIFRVFATSHPDITASVIYANPAILRTIAATAPPQNVRF